MNNPLLEIPGLGGWIASQEMTNRQNAGNLQQAQTVLGIQDAMERRAREEETRKAVAGSDGNLEAALKVALGRGDVRTAQQLAPLIHATRPRAEADNRPEILRLIDASKSLPEGDPRRAPIQSRIEMLSSRPDARGRQSQLGLLISERDALPANDPLRKIYEQAITKFQPGGVQVNINPNDPLIPGKTAQNKVDEGLLDAGMRQQQLTSIERQFKPEYQQLGTRWSALGLSIKDKIGLTDLDPGEKQFLTDFSKYKRNSIDALNQYIKSVTGAAMTNAEAERILRGLPNPGTGLFDGDSPTEFKAKMDDAIRQTRMAEARLVYIKRNGLNLADVSLDRMPRLMNERGAEIEGLIKKHQPKLSEQDVRKLVRRNLSQEFGLIE